MGVAHPPKVTVFGAARIEDLPDLGDVGRQVRFRFATGDEELAAVIPDTQVLLGWDFRTGALERVWPRARDLKWVHWAGAGVDAALFPAFRRSDVILTNARGVFDRPIAEYVLGLVLCFAKGFPRMVRAQARSHWDFRHTETLHGKTALLVGAGSIGSEIGSLLKAAGMQVTGVGRTARADDPVFGVVHPFTELDRLLETADYVVNVTPSTPDTRGLFSQARFERMHAGARFINVGRGDAVDEDALADAVRGNAIAGAALDVFAKEPLPENSPLWSLDNVIVSPHMSGDVAGSDGALIAQFLDNLGRFMRGETLTNVVDKERGY